MDDRKIFGRGGEDLAAAFFVERGYRVVERNWSCRAGEIDLVLEKEGVVHFVEVKTRHTLEYGYPEASITPSKLRHLAHAIELYLRDQIPPPTKYQADALAILVLPDKPVEYHLVEFIL